MISDFDILLYLFEESRVASRTIFTTSGCAGALDVSQQTISRKFIELEEKGLIARVPSTSGIRVSLTPAGIAFLEDKHLRLSRLLGGADKRSIRGVLASGLGEGRYYLSLKGYESQMRSKLGFIPFKGTLNLKMNVPDYREFLSGLRPIRISGFRTPERTYGEIDAYKIIVGKDIKGAIIIPKRTHYDTSMCEIVAHANLRKALKIKDGDSVLISR